MSLSILKFSAVALFVAVNILLALMGLSSIFLTITFYGSLFFLSIVLIKAMVADASLRQNLILSAGIMVASFFVCEIALKKLYKKHLSYTEANGEFFYTSPYARWWVVNMYYNYIEPLDLYQRTVNKPNSTFENQGEFTYTHHYNSLGLRGKMPDKKTNKKLIIGLGDSFTEGVGTSDDSTWVALLANSLHDTCAGLNAGIIGSDPVRELVVLKHLLSLYKPSHVVLAINTSDIEDVILRGGASRYNNKGNLATPSPPWFDMLYGCSFIARFVVHDVLHYNYFLMSNQRFERLKQDAEDSLAALIKNQYQPLAQQHQFKLIVALHPCKEELLNNNFELQSLNQKINSQTQATVVNVFDCIMQNFPPATFNYQQLYWPIDGHHNPRGYAVMAQCIANQLAPQ